MKITLIVIIGLLLAGCGRSGEREAYVSQDSENPCRLNIYYMSDLPRRDVAIIERCIDKKAATP